MFKKQRSVIGLDIGAHCVKAVELTQFGNELVVTAFGRNDVLSEGSKADAIIDLLQGNSFRTRRCLEPTAGCRARPTAQASQWSISTARIFRESRCVDAFPSARR